MRFIGNKIDSVDWFCLALCFVREEIKRMSRLGKEVMVWLRWGADFDVTVGMSSLSLGDGFG